MTQAFKYICLIAATSCAAFAQAADSEARFEIADVHTSPQASPQAGNNAFARATPPRNGRYEIHSASMVDLIRIAYGFDPDKILGGPSWLEMDRFDVIAKVPDNATPETLKPMLQSLLTDRFALKFHKDSKPLPTYVLLSGKKPLLKPADGSGDTGCRLHTSNAPPTEGGIRLMMNGGAISLGPGNTIQYECRNMTMEAFAAGLRNMLGANVGNNPVPDQTGIEGHWDFDVKWSLQINIAGPAAANQPPPVTVSEAVEKQLGLKLERQQVATPVIVVDSVNEKPTANPPGVTEALPDLPVATEFDVADIKPSAPDTRGSSSRFGNGRLTTQGTSVETLLRQAFSSGPGTLGSVEFVGLPAWAQTTRYDVTAKVPTGSPADMFSMAPMIRSMLEDRFKLKAHMEERPQNAYTLVSVKPKMKKADPASRTNCKTSNAPAGSPPGTQVLTCQNITMAQFVEQIRGRGPGLNWPVLDGTALQGGWDFALTYNNNGGFGGGRGGETGPAGADVGSADDPTGGFTIFEAVEKQLGLKLEVQKRPEPAVVIDHIEEKPTDN